MPNKSDLLVNESVEKRWKPHPGAYEVGPVPINFMPDMEIHRAMDRLSRFFRKQREARKQRLAQQKKTNRATAKEKPPVQGHRNMSINSRRKIP